MEVKDLKEFIQAIGPVLTVFGTLAAVWLTQRGSRKTLEQQIIRDELKEKRNELKETLEVYNQVIMISGENAVIDYDNNGFSKLDLEVYRQKIRPILYEKYHLLHGEIAKIVTDMDSIIGYLMYFGGGDDRTEHMNLSNKYNKLIENIEQKIHDFRKGDRS
ncbi:hypothetical protein [Bacillus wiedmannii]|uniref:hypothetical protein n=1 Tax=Bacillus wiedmannii TaxID=1890302 RepID=UPI002100268F|nr:hypothetical protein [Bacillus wiedmannii]